MRTRFLFRPLVFVPLMGLLVTATLGALPSVAAGTGPGPGAGAASGVPVLGDGGGGSSSNASNFGGGAHLSVNPRTGALSVDVELFRLNGIRGVFGRPQGASQYRQMVERLDGLVRQAMRTRKSREVPYGEAVALLEEQAGDDAGLRDAIGLLREVNQQGIFDEVPFETVWTLVQATTKIAD